jgi:diacylglycerol kinase (ATP)
MKVSLLHNPSAGEGTSAKKLRRELTAAGYEIGSEFEKGSEIEGVVDAPGDFLVVAGGDGTIRKAARALAGSGVPLAILPLGTANNIAKSLGIEGEVRDVVAGWKNARRVPFDMGLARGQWGESRFLESVGAGVVPAGIAATEEDPDHKTEDARTELVRAVDRYAEALARLQPRRWTGLLDDEPIDGEYLLVEVLNVPSVGANLILAPDADPSDGWFDVVTAGEGERRRLAEYLQACCGGAETPPALPTRRARRAEITGWDLMHVDDELRRIAEAGKVTVEIEPGAIQFLVAPSS